MCQAWNSLSSVQEIDNHPHECVLSPGHLLGTVRGAGDTATDKTKVVPVQWHVHSRGMDVDMVVLGTEIFFPLDHQEEGRGRDAKNRMDSDDSLRRQTWK